MQNVVLRLIVVGGVTLIVGLCCVEFAHAQLRVPPSYVATLASQSDEIAQVQPQLQVAAMPQSVPQAIPPTMQQPGMPQPVMPQPTTPQQGMAQQGMMGAVIVIPVVVPQHVTYTPQPVTITVHHPTQQVFPQYPVPAPMMPPMYDTMAMPMMQQQMPPMMQPISPMTQPQAPPPQPIPIKMLLPDGSTVSIKHYVPGNFFKNFVRAVTP